MRCTSMFGSSAGNTSRRAGGVLFVVLDLAPVAVFFGFVFAVVFMPPLDEVTALASMRAAGRRAQAPPPFGPLVRMKNNHEHEQRVKTTGQGSEPPGCSAARPPAPSGADARVAHGRRMLLLCGHCIERSSRACTVLSWRFSPWYLRRSCGSASAEMIHRPASIPFETVRFFGRIPDRFGMFGNPTSVSEPQSLHRGLRQLPLLGGLGIALSAAWHAQCGARFSPIVGSVWNHLSPSKMNAGRPSFGALATVISAAVVLAGTIFWL